MYILRSVTALVLSPLSFFFCPFPPYCYFSSLHLKMSHFQNNCIWWTCAYTEGDVSELLQSLKRLELVSVLLRAIGNISPGFTVTLPWQQTSASTCTAWNNRSSQEVSVEMGTEGWLPGRQGREGAVRNFYSQWQGAHAQESCSRTTLPLLFAPAPLVSICSKDCLCNTGWSRRKGRAGTAITDQCAFR